jgi:hypothetical protein
MLSPDNYTQGGSQGENRYSYVLNNPLKYSDPSGENPLGLLLGTIVQHSLTDAELIALHAAEAAALGALYVADVAQSVQAANTLNNQARDNTQVNTSGWVAQVQYSPTTQPKKNL